MRIKYKLTFTIMAIALMAAVPLSLYVLYKQEQAKIEETIKLGKSNSQILARTMIDSFLKSEGDLESARIDADEVITIYKDQFDLGLVSAETFLIIKKYRGLMLASLYKKTILSGKQKSAKRKSRITKKEIKKLKKVKGYRETNCPVQNKGQKKKQIEKCYEFISIGKYENISVVLVKLFISKSFILKPINKLRKLIILVSVAAVLGAILLGLFISKFFTSPINSLISGIKKYGDGDLTHQVKVSSKDEFRTLASAFNNMASDIQANIKEIEDYRDHLEIKVKERTRELQKTLNEVRALKVQQDGDYFLTSLLIKPLGVNRAQNENIRIDFIIQQKKRFKFKKWEAEIGGDLCIAHSITLREKKYTAFVNGDAMGKSIQGAGGALVLGVIFNSVIARTQVTASAKKKYPEQWIKDCFLELQSVFVSFDGTMMISVVMGLIDDDTGLVYFLNAEHPWTVLYRDARASFIEKESYLRKIGMTGIETSLRICTFQMLPQDMLLIGSDGRDDILLGHDNEGHRIINEDESGFLKSVEEGDGDLVRIQKSIEKRGDLTDDFTILRISYQVENQVPSDLNKDPYYLNQVKIGRQNMKIGDYDKAIEKLKKADEIFSQSDVLIDLIRSMQKNKQYKESAKVAESAIQKFPGELDFSYLASYSCKKSCQFNKAADHGERFRLRNENDIRNLVNLADVYRLMGNRNRAKIILEKVSLVNPEYPYLLKLKAVLQTEEELEV